MGDLPGTRIPLDSLQSPNRLSPLAGQQIIAVSPCCQLVHLEEDKLFKKNSNLYLRKINPPRAQEQWVLSTKIKSV